MKRIMAAAAIALAVGIASTATAAEKKYKTLPATGFTWQVSGDVVPGEWTAQYTEVMDMATNNGIPIVVFVAKSTCGRCKGLEKNILANPDFAPWAKKRGYLLLFGLLGDGEASKSLKLIRTGTSLPFCGVWWDKDGDGEPEVGNPPKTSWIGAAAKSEITFMKNADKWLGAYDPVPAYTGGSFDFEETEYDRMECDDSTETISFTLTRGEKESEFASEVDIIAIGPDGETNSTQTVSWGVGDSNKVVSVDISGANFTKDAPRATIVLVDTNGVAQASNHVTYVKAENSPANPLWIGERASPKRGLRSPASNLAFGEWTMDLDAAKALAASTEGDAYTLVAIVGSLWCGDCADTEKNFIEVKDGEGKNRFSEWAKANNVALAAIDVRRFDNGTVDPDEKRFGNSTLLSRTPGANGKSGRGYLTRKGVSDEEAAATLERNRWLVSTDTSEGGFGFHRPEDANAYRTGVPYFVLLRQDGTVAARFTRYAKKGALESDNWDDVIKRFDEMLAIAGQNGSDHADVNEIENNHAASTKQSIIANGGEAKGEISCTDLRDAYILDKFAGNATISVLVTNEESSAQVELSLWRVNDGEAAMMTGAYRTGKLSSGVSLEYAIAEAGTYAVQVAAAKRDPADELDAEFSHLNAAAMNFTAYTLTSKATYTPGPAPAEANAPDGSKAVAMQLETGVLYKIVGLDGESEANAAALEPVEGVAGFYTAKQSETVTLEAATEGGEVTYQKWEPGAVGFEPDAATQKPEVTVSESTNLLVGVRRVTGVSGEVTVKISLNKEETDFYYDIFDVGVDDNKTLPRFKVDGELGFTEKTIVWADGQPLEECVDSLLVQAADSEYGLISQYFGPGKVVFDFTIVAQTEAGEATNVVDNGKFTINFTEDQKPEAGTVAILDAANDAGEGWVKSQTIYAREDGSATLTLGRLEAAQGPIYAELTPSVKGVVFGGDYDIIGVPWDNHDDADKTVIVTNLPAAGKSVKLTLKASALSPELKVMKGSNVVTIVSVASSAPAFEEASYADTAYRYASFSKVCRVCGEGDEMSYTKVSGSLPAGLKAYVDPETKGLLISGVPTGNDKAGKTYTAVFQAVAQRGRTKVKGLTTTVSITVKDPAVAGTGADGKALNDAFAKTKKFGDVMVFKTAEDGQSAELAGMLTGLTLPAKGNASAKFVCADGTISLSAKNWSKVVDEGDPETDEDYGTLRITLAGKGGYSLDIDADRAGKVEAVLSHGDELYEEISLDGVAWSADNSAKDCMGYYTATLPVVENPDTTKAIVENREGVASRASAYLTFSMTKDSDANKGLMKWAGMLPNGEKVSGSSTLATFGDDGNVYLPYWSFKKKDDFAGVAKIMRGAKDMSATFDGADDSCYETVFAPEFDFGDGNVPVRTVWRHSENSKATKDGDYEIAYDIYGGIYDAALGLDCCCIEGRGTDAMTFSVAMPDMQSDVYGAFDGIAPLTVMVGEKSLSLVNGGTQKATLKFTAKTGIVSGGFNLSYKDASGKAKTVKATYNGVVQLGFGNACGCSSNSQPFMSGFWTFADKLSYPNAGGKAKTIGVKRGAAAVIDAGID